ncbi:hypothetical protein NIES2135_58140 [Leptolyngbya boryana NIES-2135]|jgi:hypothetical protein|uniref:Uncharacterized protein n=1 Tax=Leptolyngbya boryana NIES-2135 TaxID=1973484 RepID=A0A1Z4JQF2_LEPBY|nr:MULTISPECIES: hypothetical protein [Leptolyngbya]BAY58939.1 hypothetical protein NIES2135_58140 [Leptolyngbya boryana NIES-2135]MBD2368306.1 hypothetical protein [Leptolyngbya sp. FACHB-161]MBD2374654.1 hypothetical protein [Leptolyngbya sp. FACHB-238]MBD2399076.1 hypothetical protein [Leptolyngbya sp. FACHB-239]MBD2405082.1 hypothetical protein [Leptolyngbya sp. FACHB-402]
MNRTTEWLNGLTTKLAIALMLATGLLFVLRVCKFHIERANLSEAAAIAEKEGVIPERAFAYRDGKDYTQQELVKPYDIALDQLQQKCQESRMEIAGMVSAIVKHEKQKGTQTNHMEELKGFLHVVESGFDRHPAKCLQAYTAIVQAEK